MELDTTITEINGTIFVRIPANMADYFRLKGKDKAKITDISTNEVNIKFQSW